MTPASSPPLAERVVALNGTRSSLGQRILEALSVRPEIDRIVPIDRPATLSNLKDLVEGVTDLVVLAPGGGADADGSMLGEVDLDGARRLLSAVDAAELDHMVVVSSAMVYGAWADNAVPVTEAAVLRPNPSCSLARDKAELERLAGEWRSGRTGRSLAIVRPALVVAGDVASVEWMERSLWGAGWTGRRTADVPRQFLLVDDLVDAIVRLVIANDANGALNVAPDGWINADRQRELTGRFELPDCRPLRLACWPRCDGSSASRRRHRRSCRTPPHRGSCPTIVCAGSDGWPPIPTTRPSSSAAGRRGGQRSPPADARMWRSGRSSAVWAG